MDELKFLRYHKVFSAIVLFFSLFSAFHFLLKPSFTYFPDGTFRPFGIDYEGETLFPLWLISIIFGILSYLIILYLCSVPGKTVNIFKKSKRYRSR